MIFSQRLTDLGSNHFIFGHKVATFSFGSIITLQESTPSRRNPCYNILTHLPFAMNVKFLVGRLVPENAMTIQYIPVVTVGTPASSKEHIVLFNVRIHPVGVFLSGGGFLFGDSGG